ncbi:MAG: ribonuclease P protein component [bacterium]|nr:ribonuclease P protein component [bacterium]
MLSKPNRLVRQRDFTALFDNAKSFQGRELVLKVYAKGGKGVRIGVIISKKSAKKAVMRNRLKRLIRETMRAFVPLFPEGTDIAVITRPGVERVEEKQILFSLRQLAEKALRYQ